MLKSSIIMNPRSFKVTTILSQIFNILKSIYKKLHKNILCCRYDFIHIYNILNDRKCYYSFIYFFFFLNFSFTTQQNVTK